MHYSDIKRLHELIINKLKAMNEEYSFSDWLGAPIEPPVCNNCDCEMEWQEDFVFICPVCGEDVDIDPANDIDPDEDWHERTGND